MKKYVITTLMIFIFSVGGYAVSTRDTLSSIENGIFGYDYKNETDIKRVERLEEHLYGEKRTGQLQQRVESLQNDSGIIVENKKTKKIQQKRQH